MKARTPPNAWSVKRQPTDRPRLQAEKSPPRRPAGFLFRPLAIPSDPRALAGAARWAALCYGFVAQESRPIARITDFRRHVASRQRHPSKPGVGAALLVSQDDGQTPVVLAWPRAGSNLNGPRPAPDWTGLILLDTHESAGQSARVRAGGAHACCCNARTSGHHPWCHARHRVVRRHTDRGGPRQRRGGRALHLQARPRTRPCRRDASGQRSAAGACGGSRDRRRSRPLRDGDGIH
jgi:hypothetical protein